MTWKYLRPLRPGQPMQASWRLNRKRDVENPRWGLVTWQVDVLGPDGEVCAAGEVSRLVARRPSEEAASPGEAATPSRRRRRRRSGSAAPDSAPAPPPDAPEPAPADVPSPARRRRRRRSGGGGNGHADQPETRPEPAPVSFGEPQSTPEPAPAGLTATATSGADPEGGIGRVLKRIRRR